MPGVTLNCDIGEGFGIFDFGADDELITIVDVANVACGFHGSDFNHMRTTVHAAIRTGLAVGAHPSFPDLQGFGRREMQMGREELANCILYQVGALQGFLLAEGGRLNHIKPHGALYGMASRDADMAHAIADVALIFDVPVMGLPGTMHEQVYRARGVSFIPEFFVDRDYARDGTLIIQQKPTWVDPALAARRAREAVRSGVVAPSGATCPIETICIHSDTPNAVALVHSVSEAIRETAPCG